VNTVTSLKPASSQSCNVKPELQLRGGRKRFNLCKS